MNWMDSAACKSQPTDVFFEPEREDFETFAEFSRARTQNYKAAAKICKGCPVVNACLVENIHQNFGVWGGMKPRDRSALAIQMKMSRPLYEGWSGQDRGLTDESLNKVKELYAAGHSYKDIESLTGVRTGTIFKVVKFDPEKTPTQSMFSAKGTKNWNDPKYAEARKMLLEGKLQKKQIVAQTAISRTALRRLEMGMQEAGVL